ncbi:MAG: arginine deiminase family protein [Caldiserica bacterium]|jgi:arginine deiminase|nr:arginine deiminase family protein [Caldisericota bacterium]MDH7562584.1 arginine deiminase family protein [Caldisericota bacterium]
MKGRLTIYPKQAAEWERARVVLLSQPDIETLFALLETNSANFLYPFDLEQAKREHREFREALESLGIKVIDLREALARYSKKKEGNLESLRIFAGKSLRYEFSEEISPEDRDLLLKNKEKIIQTFDPQVLAQLIILRPKCRIRYNPNALDPTSRFISQFEVEPANNLYFMRDGLITTSKGCVIGNLTLEVRKVENEIVEFALTQMGINPIYRVRPPGNLEGGDFLPAGDFVLQGQGLLTNEEGVNQLLEHKVYGFLEVAVVKDPRSQMDEMHLDTYFNFLSRDKAILCEDRLKRDDQPEVELWVPEGTREDFQYRKKKTLPFPRFLEEKGFKIIPFSKEEQERFAPNFLLVGENRLIGVKGAGKSFWRRLEKEGVEATLIDFEALTGGYGGPHCMSQVILRG